MASGVQRAYAFTFNGLWVGGRGTCSAYSIKEARELAEAAVRTEMEQHEGGRWHQGCTQDAVDSLEVKAAPYNTATITCNGDY
jgi:hypothetical protein